MNEAVLGALSTFADSIGRDPLDPALIAATDKTLIDSFAVALAGAQTPEVRRLVETWPMPAGDSTVWGTDRTTDPATATLINGISLCSLELDEGNKFARGHPGAHVLPAAVAEAERLGSSAEDLRAAFLAGYEVAARIARGFQPRPGLHPHGTWGAIGAAVAVAKLNGADAETIAGAMDAAAGLSLAPPFSSATKGTFVRNAWVGQAGAHGIAAARLALADLAPQHETGMAVFDDLLGTLDPHEIVDGLGERFEISGGYFKRHSACNYTHPPADAALEIRARSGFRPGDVIAIRVDTHALAAPLDEKDPTSRLAAMFSIPHVVAVALHHGACAPTSFAPDALGRIDVARLRGLVDVALDDEIDARRPAERGARVSVTMTDGSTIAIEVRNAIGDADFHPFDRARIEEKAAALIGSERASAVADLVDSFPRTTDVRNITTAIRGEKSPTP